MVAVSLLIPFCNAAATLKATLASVQRQSFPHFECLLLDDASADSSPALVAAIATTDPRFRLVACPRRGLVAALNHGIEISRAPFIARLDADDLCHRERIEWQLRALSSAPELAGVGCHVRIFPRKQGSGMQRHESFLNSLRTPEDVLRNRFVECPLVHSSYCFRREVMQQFAYHDCSWPEDYDFLLRVLGAELRVGIVNRRLVGWRDRVDGLTRTAPHCTQSRIRACKAHYLARGFLGDSDRYVLWGYGDTGRLLRTALLFHGKEPAAIVERHPRRIGQKIHGAPVVPPSVLPQLDALPIVVSVAGDQNRRLIRGDLERMDFCELEDYVMVA